MVIESMASGPSSGMSFDGNLHIMTYIKLDQSMSRIGSSHHPPENIHWSRDFKLSSVTETVVDYPVADICLRV
jgi:hypothetical protein